MNITPFKNVNTIIVLFTFFIFFSCEEDEPPLSAAIETLHIDEFGAYLEENLGDKCVGMQYAIVQDGQLELNNAIGKSRLDVDGGNIDYHKLQRKSIHSCSKTITAALLVDMLDLYDVPLDTNISVYLPDSWDKTGLEAKNISLNQLLRHRSGLRGTKDSYQAMKDYIEAGEFENKVVEYANINFTLMRIIIPNISGTQHVILENLYESEGEEAYAQEVAEWYIYYTKDRILKPAGISEEVLPKIWDQSQFPTSVYNYNFSNQSNPGYTHTDQTLLTGAGGWYMNAKELAAFITYLSTDNLQNIDYKRMWGNEYGMYSGMRSGIRVITHNGASGTREDGSGAGGRSIWVHIPEREVIVTMQINSAANNFTLEELLQTIVDGYLDSIHI